MTEEATTDGQRSAMHRRLVDALYLDAMLLADEARGYFEAVGRSEREALDPAARVDFACESLRVTTRLTHVIAWLLTQRAVEAGELVPRQALHPSRRLGDAAVSDEKTVALLPPQARALVAASEALYRRAAAQDAALAAAMPGDSPVHSMQERLAGSF